jgi:hypothetical protein
MLKIFFEKIVMNLIMIIHIIFKILLMIVVNVADLHVWDVIIIRKMSIGGMSK